MTTKFEAAEKAAEKLTARSTAAFHESGHVVIALVLGRKVKRVSIDDDGDGGKTDIKLGTNKRSILIALAGPYAQRRHAPDSGWRSRNHTGFGSDADFDVVTDLIYEMFGIGEVAERCWAKSEALIEQLVNQHWEQIERVAQALIERGVIEGAELEHLVFPARRTSSRD
jgi:hypothetical protein